MKKSSGFTLVEMLVSVALFAIVVTVAMGALLTVLRANRKAQALQSVMNNLNFTLEQMSRDIRVGTRYACGGATSGPEDCSIDDGNTAFAFRSHRGEDVVYTLNSGSIQRSINGGTTQDVTSDEITIENLNFGVYGSYPSDDAQPRVLITLNGYAGPTDAAQAAVRTYFNLQTSVSSRLLDR